VLSTTFSFAPAGVLGSGSADARPYACAAVPSLKAPVAVLEGTRVPVAGLLNGMARRRAEEALAGFGTAIDATDLPIAPQHDPINQNDGTTLGIHPRGRSTS